MRFILKLIAAPIALALVIVTAFFSFITSVSNMIFGIASGLVFIAAVILFVMGLTTGGIAFLVIAILISPAGLPALAKWFVKGLAAARGALRTFLFS